MMANARLPRLTWSLRALLLASMLCGADSYRAIAQDAPAPANDCDRLAQPARRQMGRVPAFADGVDFAQMDSLAARPACVRAMTEFPREPRFVAYAARATAKAGDDREAARLYRLAADQGNALAQNNYGAMVENGEAGLRRDMREAARLYRLSAEQGFTRAYASLGTLFEFGRGVTRDEREAVRLFRLAAEQDDLQGQTNLGVMYAEGRGGLSRDSQEAARLWRLAAAQGSDEARNNLRKMGVRP